MKNIAILGSTGSIGTQTLEVVKRNPDLKVVSLAAMKSIDELEKQMREFHPLLVCVYDEEKCETLKKRVSDLDVEIVSGMEGLIKAATIKEADIVMQAVVGMIGIRPTIKAIEEGKDIAFANKETLVCAGHIIMPLVKKHNVKLLPVDSEHSAIFQCLHGEEENKIKRILLTASGGPFRNYVEDQFENIKVEDALKHPNWSMGNKITIDSATMVNKGLEVMEAKWLFDVSYDQIEVVVQPQSVIHSMVEFEDGAVKAQLGTPSMRVPIQYALFYPERRKFDDPGLNFYDMGNILVSKPNPVLLKSIELAISAGRKGGNMPTIFNAANEFAVSKFLHREIGFLDILTLIKKGMELVPFIENPSLEEILETEKKVVEVLS